MPDNKKNAFSNFFTAWTGENPFMSSLEVDKYIEAWRGNAKAFTDISASILDHLHDLSGQQVKIVQKNAEQLAKFFTEMTDASTKPEDKIACHAEELADKVVKHGTATGEIINKRATELFSELAKPGQPSAKKEKAKQAA